MISVSTSDSIQHAEQLGATLLLGASASDSPGVSDQIHVDKFIIPADVLISTDSVRRDVHFIRGVSDADDVSDAVFIGDMVLLAETILDGVKDGPAEAHTASPFGPVSPSAGDESPTGPVGFSVSNGDQIAYNDELEVDLQ